MGIKERVLAKYSLLPHSMHSIVTSVIYLGNVRIYSKSKAPTEIGNQTNELLCSLVGMAPTESGHVISVKMKKWSVSL